MKPIDVIRKLVKDTPNDMQLGELVRQYIRELEPPQNWIEGMSRERKGTWPGLDKILGGWIYESPDGGETIYKRPFMDYNPENKIKLTKEQWKLEKEK